MKHRLSAIILCLLACVAMYSCRTQPSLPGSRNPGKAATLPVYGDPQGSAAVPDTARCDSLLSRILALENAVYCDPGNRSRIPGLVKASFDSSSGCFLVVGKGTHNKSLPESSWRQGRKIASAYDAKRWALYLKSWSLGSTARFGAKISGEITYSRILLEKLEGDTLFTLVSVPTGSIIEK
jgi:hypothetical protein